MDTGLTSSQARPPLTAASNGMAPSNQFRVWSENRAPPLMPSRQRNHSAASVMGFTGQTQLQ